ncbi:MAG: glycerophosphodiester phosphodiesterase family protein [Mycolicibacterium sp.]|uniref:glycerophosphodiester phosphodiesterase family protein n=1 Tax=Mycolicibacterium sp. TaxID=2320850 RepID=UPI003D0C4D19
MLGVVALLFMLGGPCGLAEATPLDLDDEPMIIAHRGGTGDFPENTIVAISNAVAHGVDGVWLTVQASSDAVPVLYRPTDLATLTDGSGPVNSKTAEQLVQLNAGWSFTQSGADGYPYRQRPTPIPTLEQAIAVMPPDLPLFLDLKQTPAQPLVSAVAQVLTRTGAAGRSVIFSTDAAITDAAAGVGLQTAESRDRTRQRLLDLALNHHCDPPRDPGKWAGFEVHREFTVTEEFTLGVGATEVNAQLWDPPAVECFTAQPGMKVMGFAVNTFDDYQRAKKVGLDAVLVDSPAAAQRWRAE